MNIRLHQFFGYYALLSDFYEYEERNCCFTVKMYINIFYLTISSLLDILS